MTITLSRLRQLDWHWLTEGAKSFIDAATAMSGWQGVLTQVNSLPWTGTGKVGASVGHEASAARGTSSGAQLMADAASVTATYNALMANKQELLAQVDALTARQYQVADDFTVSVPMPPPFSTALGLSEAEASAQTQVLKTHIGAIEALDSQARVPPKASLTSFKTGPGDLWDLPDPTEPGPPPGVPPGPLRDFYSQVLGVGGPPDGWRTPPEGTVTDPFEMRLITQQQDQDLKDYLASLPTGCSQSELMWRLFGTVIPGMAGTVLTAGAGDIPFTLLAAAGTGFAIRGLQNACAVGPGGIRP